jgi:hypothetical protein
LLLRSPGAIRTLKNAAAQYAAPVLADALATPVSGRNRVGEIARGCANHERGAGQFRPPYGTADFLFSL